MAERRRALIRLVLACASALAALLAVELVFRLNRERFGVRVSELWELRAYVCDGRSRFRPTAYYGWVFDPKRPGVNASGFLGPDVARARTPGVLRIACLGGSTTAGDLFQGYAASYPGALAEILGQKLGAPVEVLNFGVAGWTTAESLVNWMLNVQDYQPDVVVIHHAVNDVLPRLAPGFRSDYTHYTHPWTAESFAAWRQFLTRRSDLFAAYELKGPGFLLADHVSIPPDELGHELTPDTAAAFRRNLASLIRNVRWGGATPVLMTMPWRPAPLLGPLDAARVAGMRAHNEITRELARTEDCALDDLAAVQDAALAAEFVDIVHFTARGNRRKADLLAAFLAEHALLTPRAEH